MSKRPLERKKKRERGEKGREKDGGREKGRKDLKPLDRGFLGSIPTLCVRAKSLQSCPILCDPMDCTTPGASIHRVLQARILEWVAMPSSRDLHHPGTEPGSPVLTGRFFTTEPPRMVAPALELSKYPLEVWES